MAALASSAVTTNWSYLFGGQGGKRAVMKNVTMNLTGQGGTSNTITAAVLGLKKIDGCSNAYGPGGPALYPAAPSNDGAILVLVNLAQATDASRVTPADITDSAVTVTVWGQPA